MKTKKLFNVVICSLAVGFFVGFAAGLDNHPKQEPHSVEWETLLASSVALLGGWMAYMGATLPYRQKKKAIAEKFYMDIVGVSLDFLDATQTDQEQNEKLLDIFMSDLKGSDQDEITTYAKRALDQFPEFPVSLTNKELFVKYLGAKRGLQHILGQQDRFKEVSPNECHDEIRKLIKLTQKIIEDFD